MPRLFGRALVDAAEGARAGCRSREGERATVDRHEAIALGTNTFARLSQRDGAPFSTDAGFFGSFPARGTAPMFDPESELVAHPVSTVSLLEAVDEPVVGEIIS